MNGSGKEIRIEKVRLKERNETKMFIFDGSQQEENSKRSRDNFRRQGHLALGFVQPCQDTDSVIK
jgi:hypothetical protein